MTRLLLGGLVACLVGAALFFFVPWAAAVARRREIMIITPWIWIAAAACFFAVLLLLLCGASALNVTAQRRRTRKIHWRNYQLAFVVANPPLPGGAAVREQPPVAQHHH
jgi:hypothetical protein